MRSAKKNLKSTTTYIEPSELMEGGASSGALPHFKLGVSDMSRMSVPPSRNILAWRTHQGQIEWMAVHCADWMYLFCAETWFATIVNSLPFAMRIELFAKIGLPISYTGFPGQTG